MTAKTTMRALALAACLPLLGAGAAWGQADPLDPLTQPQTDPLTDPFTDPTIQPAPGEPLPAEPLPAEPLPGEPLPGEPLPGEPLPAEPLPLPADPAQPLPGEPLPAEPLPADPLPAPAVPADPAAGDQARIDYEAAHNQLGVLEYCQSAGFVSADVVELQRYAITLLPAPADTAGAGTAEATGRDGIIVLPGQQVALGDAAAQQGTTVAELCQRIEATLNAAAGGIQAP